MIRYTYFLLSFLLFFGFACVEERIEPTVFGIVKGKVIDDMTDLPLSGVTVTTSPSTAVITTDANGNFILTNVPVGAATIRTEYSGYRTNTEAVTVLENDTVSVSIRMSVNVSTNELPSAPINLVPLNGAIDLLTDTVKLRWHAAIDPNTNDQIKYDVFLFAAGAQPDTIAIGLTDTCFNLVNLDYQTTYYWQVIAQDSSAVPVLGPTWQFTTRAIPNHPILFARKTNGNYHIWSAAADGSDQIQLTNLSANQWRPRRNAQRTRIAFLSDEGIQTSLYTMNNDGSDIQLATILPISGVNDLDLDMTWSPDGSKILFMSGNKLYTVAPDGSGLAVFATAPAGFTYTEVDWNGNLNTVLARTTGAHIYESQILRYNGAGAFQATELTDLPGREGGPALNIVGDRYLFTNDTSGLNSADGRQLDSRIYIKPIGNVNQFSASVTKPPGTNDIDPRYSANGAQIIFVNTDNTGIGVKNICTVSLAGIMRVVLIPDGEMPDWE
jgi:TolB protein